MDKDESQGGDQLYFPFCGYLECSPQIYDYFKSSFEGINKRLIDMTELICHMEKKIHDKYDREIRNLHEKIRELETK